MAAPYSEDPNVFVTQPPPDPAEVANPAGVPAVGDVPTWSAGNPEYPDGFSTWQPPGVSALTVEDGSTTVTPVTVVKFTAGATVTNAGGGEADVAISGGSSPVKIVRFPFVYNTPNLLTGVTVYQPTAGDFLSYAGVAISLPTVWNGTTPQASIGVAGAPVGLVGATLPLDIGGNAQIGSSDAKSINAAGSGSMVIFGTDPVLLVVDDGAGGSPGASQGSATVVLVIWAAP